MWHLVDVVRRNIKNMKKSSRVADENMFEVGNNIRRTRQHGWNGFSLVCNILQAPISVLSCVSHPHVNGYDHDDGVWVTNEFAHVSEINHLMLNDSMRYAILM
ncbi:hypothetical protein Lal_00012968 [Lupinus albus]|uniref:Uncharacterized protein n=1 Tax=Lupinus albus TaxID=3870 RepID=A0A6A5NHK7_LUPAL|nr:hypothetical protein Lalb_Chr19g0125521 [Lupinus albus]KAF1884008.1 hypothetical protein Lal_00012968 [Lupinus albus]